MGREGRQAETQASAVRPKVAVLVGSPRRQGASARLAQALCGGIAQAGGDALLLQLADCEVRPCVGCGACEASGTCVLDAHEARAGKPGHAALREALEACEALALVAPVYFSGPPSQLKAVFDRMQPLWCRRYILRARPVLPHAARKPFHLVVTGGGGDPFGFAALQSCAHSALRMLDFELGQTRDAVGFGQPARPGFDFGGEFDRRILAQAELWARDLLRACHTQTHPHDFDEV